MEYNIFSADWWTWNGGTVFLAFCTGVAFAVGHEIVKAIVKRYTKEPW
jgi:hypothetical protein